MTDSGLTVIMPLYNGAATIERTLQSLVAQSDGAFHVIVVDQASADGSRAVVERYADRLSLRIIDAPDSKSWTTNSNIGIKAATTPLIAFLHQDDLWFADRVAAVRAAAERHPEARLILHGTSYVDGSDRPVGRFDPAFGKTPRLMDSTGVLRRMLVQNTIAVPSVTFRREDALAAGGLDENLWYTADWDFWLKLIQLGPVAWIPDGLAGFRIHTGSLTMTGSRNVADFARQLEIPLERHLTSLPERDRARVRIEAGAARAINLYLADRYHGGRPALKPVLSALRAVGPLRWARFLRDTQLVQRVLPRLKLRRQ